MSYSITIWTTDGEEREYGGFTTRDEAEVVIFHKKGKGVLALANLFHFAFIEMIIHFVSFSIIFCGIIK